MTFEEWDMICNANSEATETTRRGWFNLARQDLLARLKRVEQSDRIFLANIEKLQEALKLVEKERDELKEELAVVEGRR